MVKMVNFMLYIFYHNKKKIGGGGTITTRPNKHTVGGFNKGNVDSLIK